MTDTSLQVSKYLIHPFHYNSFHVFYQGSLVPCTFVPSSLIHSLHNTSFYILLIGWLVPSSLVHSSLVLHRLVPSSCVHLSLILRTFFTYNNSLLTLGSSSLIPCTLIPSILIYHSSVASINLADGICKPIIHMSLHGKTQDKHC